ncbi:hypothetical protein [Vibrio panuliri]|uniref:hypothetical protein n=1 Tax=Vibrio panuliri TaxID=1381081 RepID=UPI001245FA62|nr:hypothetical protein [Vibrio panuliri]KAB1459030.1 hypothetical protein F7O85_03760 [Vibrio panuliri]
MKVAFLHTLAANQILFDDCIQESQLAKFADVMHCCAPELLEYASGVGFDAHLANQVAGQVRALEQQGADWIVCTCSSIGRLAESSLTHHAKVLRVDRPMAQKASQAKQLTVLAALPTTIEPTMSLLAEYRVDIEQFANVRVIDVVWQHYLAGDLATYQQAIANYLDQYCSDDEVVLLAQASMAPAMKLLSEVWSTKVLTSPSTCLEYLVGQLMLPSEQGERDDCSS